MLKYDSFRWNWRKKPRYWEIIRHGWNMKFFSNITTANKKQYSHQQEEGRYLSAWTEFVFGDRAGDFWENCHLQLGIFCNSLWPLGPPYHKKHGGFKVKMWDDYCVPQKKWDYSHYLMSIYQVTFAKWFGMTNQKESGRFLHAEKGVPIQTAFNLSPQIMFFVTTKYVPRS